MKNFVALGFADGFTRLMPSVSFQETEVSEVSVPAVHGVYAARIILDFVFYQLFQDVVSPEVRRLVGAAQASLSAPVGLQTIATTMANFSIAYDEMLLLRSETLLLLDNRAATHAPQFNRVVSVLDGAKGALENLRAFFAGSAESSAHLGYLTRVGGILANTARLEMVFNPTQAVSLLDMLRTVSPDVRSISSGSSSVMINRFRPDIFVTTGLF